MCVVLPVDALVWEYGTLPKGLQYLMMCATETNMEPVSATAAATVYGITWALEKYNDHYYAPKYGHKGRLEGLSDFFEP
jgi:hypothetical protein